jgi:hypothetical protein
MGTYHICYLLGTNVISKDYTSALREFNKKFIGKEIVYITKLY